MTKEIEKVNTEGSQSAPAVRVLHPSVDIQELADSFVVRLDIPGAEKTSILAQVHESMLKVSAKVPEHAVQVAELTFDDSTPVEYRREFSLADNIETNSVDALYELGVLKITLKKKQQYLPKEVKIQ